MAHPSVLNLTEQTDSPTERTIGLCMVSWSSATRYVQHSIYAGIFWTNRPGGDMDHAWVGCRSVGDIQNPTRGWTAVSSETTQHQHEWTGRNLNLQKRKENIAYRPHPCNREQANLRARYKRPVSTHTVCIYRKTKAIIIGLMVWLFPAPYICAYILCSSKLSVLFFIARRTRQGSSNIQNTWHQSKQINKRGWNITNRSTTRFITLLPIPQWLGVTATKPRRELNKRHQRRTDIIKVDMCSSSRSICFL
jgi:hypothetical protein